MAMGPGSWSQSLIPEENRTGRDIRPAVLWNVAKIVPPTGPPTAGCYRVKGCGGKDYNKPCVMRYIIASLRSPCRCTRDCQPACPS